MILQLAGQTPFAKGGNRLCFVHPLEPGRCIKVRRPDFSLEDCRRKKGFPRNLRPLSAFDDNLEEYRVVSNLEQSRGEEVYKHIFRCYGFVETDMGKGLETELVRDESGAISWSLKQYIWEEGYTGACRDAVRQLGRFWEELRIPSRDLLTHNIVVQQDSGENIKRLVVIDGLGSSAMVPFHWLPQTFQRQKIRKRVRRLEERIQEFVRNCENGKKPSTMGMLAHRDAIEQEKV